MNINQNTAFFGLKELESKKKTISPWDLNKAKTRKGKYQVNKIKCDIVHLTRITKREALGQKFLNMAKKEKIKANIANFLRKTNKSD